MARRVQCPETKSRLVRGFISRYNVHCDVCGDLIPFAKVKVLTTAYGIVFEDPPQCSDCDGTQDALSKASASAVISVHPSRARFEQFGDDCHKAQEGAVTVVYRQTGNEFVRNRMGKTMVVLGE